MKKFLIAALTLLFLALIADTAYYRWGFYIDFNKDAPIECFATTDEKEIVADTGKGLEPFEIKGVNLGAGIPGHFATEFAIDKETYLRWFQMIQDMGANSIRVYTILSPSFYEAVYEYNINNPNPLYLIHGVWVNDYVLNSHVDGFDKSFFKQMKKDCRTLVDVLHGKKKLNLSYDAAGGTGSYKRDVSQWVLGYIIGVEWEDVTVAYTDNSEPERNVYSGTYMYTTEDASPFEAMLAEVGDSMIAYESKRYKQQRLVAFSNWVTTDPFEYPAIVESFFLKCAIVDVENIKTTDEFISGQFASYHVYPYYPDYYNFYTEWRQETPDIEKYVLEDGGYNTYGAYLENLNAHHTMPVIIAEFGIPSSRGAAQVDHNTGRSQGRMSEKEQGYALVECYDDIMNAGCAGSIVFSWQDEWFKRTWNTMANVDLTQTSFWSDYQTNEQFFGLLTFDPGKERSVCYVDGDMEEWTEEDLLLEDGGYKLYTKYDEKFIYLRINKENLNFDDGEIYLPIDITPKTGSFYAPKQDVRFDREADFLLVLNGEDESRLLVHSRYDVFYAVYAEDFDLPNPYISPPGKNVPEFNEIYMSLQLQKVDPERYEVDEVAKDIGTTKFETGKLTYGNANPYSEGYNSLADFIVNGDDIEIRLPWQLLNFSNPSKMTVHDDYYEHYGIENMKISGIYMGIGDEQSKDNRISMQELELSGWGRNPTSHERLKESYYILQQRWSNTNQGA